MDHPKLWLRYVEASSVSDQTLELDAMTVRNGAGEELGTVDGLVVDSGSGHPRYVVVDAGGWFTSKQFLVPIGQVHVAAGRGALLVSLTKEQIGRFPGFDIDRFKALNENDIERINEQLDEVYEPGVPYTMDQPFSAAADRASWTASDAVQGWWDSESSPADEPSSADTDPASPHFDGRAQPGDVLGIETEGERTYVGDTKDDEVERRRATSQAAKPVER